MRLKQAVFLKLVLIIQQRSFQNQPIYLTTTALPFPLWMMLISPLKAPPAPLRYVKLRQNSASSVQQKHRAVFCLLILPAFLISGACLLQMLEILYLSFIFCLIRSVRWVQPPRTLAGTVIPLHSFPSYFINAASSTPVPSAGRGLPQAGPRHFRGSPATHLATSSG